MTERWRKGQCERGQIMQGLVGHSDKVWILFWLQWNVTGGLEEGSNLT